jgi:hypothetical protein
MLHAGGEAFGSREEEVVRERLVVLEGVGGGG